MAKQRNKISSFSDFVDEKVVEDEGVDQIISKIKELFPDVEQRCDLNAAKNDLIRRKAVIDKAKLMNELFKMTSSLQSLLTEAGVPPVYQFNDLFLTVIIRLESLGLIEIK